MPKPALTSVSTSPRQRKSVTIKDIAAKLGLSFQAVSQALNPRENTSRVSEATKKRVVATARKMGYREHQAARVLRSARSGLLGVVIFDHPHHVMQYRLHHVLAEVHAAGYRPFVHLADTWRTSGSMDGCLTMLDANVEGVLFVDPIGFPDESPADILLAAQIPVISIGAHQWRRIASYQVDRLNGYHALTKHLLLAGARSFMLMHADIKIPHRRYFQRFLDDMTAGFRMAIKEGEKDFGPLEARVRTVELAMEQEETKRLPIHPIHRSSYLTMKELLLQEDLPDALLFQADCWAQGALWACYESGVHVPTDLLVTGFNDEPGGSTSSPPLTTMAQPHAEIARRAIADMVAQIRGGIVNAHGHVTTVPGFLVERASTGQAENPFRRLHPSLRNP